MTEMAESMMAEIRLETQKCLQVILKGFKVAKSSAGSDIRKES